jgi:hypothetical protein
MEALSAFLRDTGRGDRERHGLGSYCSHLWDLAPIPGWLVADRLRVNEIEATWPTRAIARMWL